MKEFSSLSLRNPAILFVLFLFAILCIWWLVLHLCIQNVSSEALQLWGASYQILAWFGAIMGLVYSRRWGGLKSMVGKVMLAFSFGLIFQSFGQTTYSLYVYALHMPIPYPSIGDVGFFGSIPFYFYGAFLLAKIAGAKAVLRSYSHQLLAIVVPIALLCLSSFFFLQGYVFDNTQPLKTFLDFGYPLGQALYVSMALLAFLLSRNILGGMMRLPLLFFILALISQYLSDFTFLYEASKDIYYSGSFVDFMYMFSYLIMSIALIHAGNMFTKVKET